MTMSACDGRPLLLAPACVRAMGRCTGGDIVPIGGGPSRQSTAKHQLLSVTPDVSIANTDGAPRSDAMVKARRPIAGSAAEKSSPLAKPPAFEQNVSGPGH